MVEDAKVATTVEITDVVNVDVDASGQAVGVEFLALPNAITRRMVQLAAKRFHELEPLVDLERWAFPSNLALT
jgi:uncharacterized protein YuzE